MVQIHKLRHLEPANLDGAIGLVEDALRMCDALGHAYVAIDLSAAAAKLRAIRDQTASSAARAG